jgi:hypothetical protein
MQIEAYEPGTIKRFTPKINDDCEDLSDNECLCGNYHSDEFEGKAYLPHSCQEWIIGGPDEIRALIADLEEVLIK